MHGAVKRGWITPRPCPGPSRPPSGPGLLQMSHYHHSPPGIILQAPPQCEGWCSWRSRPESHCLWGWAETKHLHLQRAPRSTRRRSWRRARRIPQESFGRSLAWPQPSCSGCWFSDFSEGSVAFWPCSSWSPSSLLQSQTAPCLLSGSRLHPSCICEESTRNTQHIYLSLYLYLTITWITFDAPVAWLLWLTWSENVQRAISARASCEGEVWECNTRRRPYRRYGIYIWTSPRPVNHITIVNKI